MSKFTLVDFLIPGPNLEQGTLGLLEKLQQYDLSIVFHR